MIFVFDRFELDTAQLEVRCQGEKVKLDALSVRLLGALVGRAGEVLSKAELLEQVWDRRDAGEGVLTVTMARLRKRLVEHGSRGELIATVYGRGYRFDGVVERVRGDDAEATATSAQAALARAPFVGRVGTLARLEQAFQDARAGRGKLCALLGEPGIGKTRCVEALAHALSERSVALAWGSCLEASDTPPLWPFRTLLCELERLAWDRAPLLAQMAAALIAELDEGSALPEAGTRRAAGYLGSLRVRLLDRVWLLLERAARELGLVYVLEDLHRADAASLALLDYAVDRVARSPVLLIVTARGEAASGAPSAVLGHRNCERIVLQPLALPDVSRYVGATTADPDGGLARAVFDKSEGNPFFMVELSRQLGGADAPTAASLRVPDAALEIVRARVTNLSEATRALLEAAVTGSAPSVLMASLDEALSAQVIGVRPEASTSFAFRHELLRTVLQDALSPAAQRALHGQVARALEERAGSGHPVPPSELASHFHAALPDCDAARALHHCMAAASASSQALATRDVVRYLGYALEALDLCPAPLPELRMQLLYRRALCARIHASDEIDVIVQELVALARAQGDAVMLVRAAVLLNLHPGMLPIAESAGTLEHALSKLPPEHHGSRAIALAALACAAPCSFSRAQSDAKLAEAEREARASGSRLARYSVLFCRLCMQTGPGRPEATALEQELALFGQAHPHVTPMLPLDLALHRAVRALTEGDGAAVEREVDTAVARAHETGHIEIAWHAARMRVLARMEAGDFAAARVELPALHARARGMRLRGVAPFCAFDRAVVLGKPDEGAFELERARSACVYDRADPPGVWSLKVRALEASGAEREARIALHAVEPEALAALPRASMYLGTLGHLVKAALRLEERAYIEALYGLLVPHQALFAGHFAFFCEGSVAQLCGMLSLALGEHERALDELERGVALAERKGRLRAAGEARIELARCMLQRDRAGDRSRALTLVSEVLTHARQAGATGLARAASGVLRDASVR